MSSGALVGGGELDCGRRSMAVSSPAGAGTGVSWRSLVSGDPVPFTFCLGAVCCLRKAPNPPSDASSAPMGVVNLIVSSFAGAVSGLVFGNGPTIGLLILVFGMLQSSESILPPDRLTLEADMCFL